MHMSEAGAAEPKDVRKPDKLNYGVFYRPDVWITFDRPAQVRTFVGTKRVRAVGISLDDPQGFLRDWRDRRGGSRQACCFD